MEYDKGFWDAYAGRTRRDTTKSLQGLSGILQARCDAQACLRSGAARESILRLFPDTFRVAGVDLNDTALAIAADKMPSATFEKGSIADLPFEDSSVDFVFTHQLLNYLDDDTLEKGVGEMYRVAGRYVMNCEKYGPTEEQIDDHHRYRNMSERWSGYNVRMVSNVDMHEDIDPDRSRFTLLRKL